MPQPLPTWQHASTGSDLLTLQKRTDLKKAVIFDFFQLPRELRDQIYEEAGKENKPLQFQHRDQRGNRLYAPGGVERPRQSFLLVSRQYSLEYKQQVGTDQTLILSAMLLRSSLRPRIHKWHKIGTNVTAIDLQMLVSIMGGPSYPPCNHPRGFCIVRVIQNELRPLVMINPFLVTLQCLQIRIKMFLKSEHEEIVYRLMDKFLMDLKGEDIEGYSLAIYRYPVTEGHNAYGEGMDGFFSPKKLARKWCVQHGWEIFNEGELEDGGSSVMDESA